MALAPSSSKAVTLDVRHRIELLMRCTSEIRSFNERIVRTIQAWQPRGSGKHLDVADESGRRRAAPRLLAREERSRAGWLGRLTPPARRAFAAMVGSGTLLRRAAPQLRYLADSGMRRQLQRPLMPAPADRHRPLAAARLCSALKHVAAPQGRDAISLRRSVLGNGLLFASPQPYARPARWLAAATLVLSRSGKPQALAVTHAARAVRPVELTWRTKSAGSPPRESATLQRDVVAASQRTAAIGVHSRSAMQGEPLLSDSRAINRLAEDVLGRIERKLRVERERRGL
ncbi:hypothetical protein [Bradyrhizobium japonicum]|uniref:hypothetical protein n=1 Tax=Bradyrhizobium japonicum TaxID=375 RepID=UPI00216AA52D|nr:hypothetical protein [Bradyrhizobium japonicum]